MNKLPPISVKKVSVVVPAYKSEATIERLVEKTIEDLSPHYGELEVVIVNDGSPDNTHECVLRAVRKHPDIVKYIHLARNFSEHSAVICGLHFVTGDCVAIIDDDFQNPPAEIVKLVEKLKEGFDVVYSYYQRKRHSWFRNFGSRINDRFATWLLKKPAGLYLSSFKVIHISLVKNIIKYRGPFPYIDGILLRNTDRIGRQLVDHHRREEGRSNYSLARLIKLWLNMFTGFSVVPLRFASFLGIAISCLTPFLILFYILAYRSGGIFVKQMIPPGWASLIILIIFFGGLQLMVLGMMGEYIGRMFLTVNQEPQFVIRTAYINGKESDVQIQ